MSQWPLIPSLLTGLSTLGACAALWLAISAYRRCPTFTLKRTRAELQAVLTDLNDLHLQLESLNKKHRRLQSKVGMSHARAAKKGAVPTDESPQEWKARMRKEMAITHGRRQWPTTEKGE
jgi:hypothetical protein